MVTLNEVGNVTNRSAVTIYGLSTDTKPIDKWEGQSIENGSWYIEIDTGYVYLFDKENKLWIIYNICNTN